MKILMPNSNSIFLPRGDSTSLALLNNSGNFCSQQLDFLSCMPELLQHVAQSCNQIFGHLRVNCGKLLELRLFQRLILRKTLQNLVKFFEVTGDKETGEWN